MSGFEDMCCLFANGDAIGDLYALAECDHIIATSSTYSRWASYWGDKGIFTMRQAGQPISSLEDFTVFEWDFSAVEV